MTPGGERASTGTAFGLDLTGNFSAPGLLQGAAPRAGGRSTVLRRLGSGGLDEWFVLGGAETLIEHDLGGGSLAIHRHPRAGFLLETDFYGRFRVSPDGTAIDCAPRELPDWLWQRFLAGQLLPLAAVLQGLEPLHAGAVVIGGRAVLLLGASGAGKTSVALHLNRLGAGFLTDDVTALEAFAGGVIAHPGAALASVAAAELARLTAADDRALSALGTIDGEVRVIVEGSAGEPCEVAGVYLVVRRTGATEVTIEGSPPDWPAALLGATFNAYQRDRSRLVTQLEVCAKLVDTARLRQVTAPLEGPAANVARAILGSVEEGS